MLNPEAIASMVNEYREGQSTPQLAARYGITASTVRFHVRKYGAMRSRAEGVRNAFMVGRMENRKSRAGVPQSEAAKAKLSASMRRSADGWAKGYRINTNGYVEYTRRDDPNFGRLAHVVLMEERIGRRLLGDECVHHIDGDKLNNSINNLALVTRAGHSRLHRFEEGLAGVRPLRTIKGRFKEKFGC